MKLRVTFLITDPTLAGLLPTETRSRISKRVTAFVAAENCIHFTRVGAVWIEATGSAHQAQLSLDIETGQWWTSKTSGFANSLIDGVLLILAGEFRQEGIPPSTTLEARILDYLVMSEGFTKVGT